MTELTEQEITRASFWIRRWKMVGGGFHPRLTKDGFTVQTVRRPDPDPRIEAVLIKTAGLLEQELRDNPKKHAVVAEMVRQSFHRQNPGLHVVDNCDQDPPNAA